MTNDILQSNTISFLRFPLIVGVVLIHSQFDGMEINGISLVGQGSFPVYEYFSCFFSNILSRIAVPLFYFISGFLFFYKTDSFIHKVYCQKLKKRINSLLVPYILWNILVVIFFWLSQTFFTHLMSGQGKLIVDYTFADWLWVFWNTGKVNSVMNSGFPICYQFWFIRDLIVVVLFSPVIYLCVKMFKYYVVLCLGIFWFFDLWFSVVGISITAIFFFSAGAFFSIYKKNFVVMMKPFLFYALITYIAIVVMELYFKDKFWCVYLHNIGILVGIIGITAISAYFIEKNCWRVNSFLSESSFFIFAFHALPLVFVKKIFFKYVQPSSDLSILVLYFLCPVIIILTGLLFYSLLKRCLPKITALITGGR